MREILFKMAAKAALSCRPEKGQMNFRHEAAYIVVVVSS
jgi:hypothetical protein